MAGGVDFRIDLSDDTLQTVAGLEEVTPKVNKAIDRARKKLVKWVITMLTREMRANLNLPTKALKPRIRTNKSNTIIWLGINPMSAHKAGNSRQNRRGTRAGKYQFDGAFLFHQQPNRPIWIRERRNRSAGHFVMPGKDYSKSDGDHYRYPLQMVGIEIKENSTELFGRIKNRTNERFKTLLEQEINFALNVEN